jgi:hypothetical protein
MRLMIARSRAAYWKYVSMPSAAEGHVALLRRDHAPYDSEVTRNVLEIREHAERRRRPCSPLEERSCAL